MVSSSLGYAGAVAWRRYWYIYELARSRAFGPRVGYERRSRLEATMAEPVQLRVPRPRSPVTDQVAVVTATGQATLSVWAARFFGLDPIIGRPGEATALIEGATDKAWPALVLAGSALDEPASLALSGYLASGGHALVTGLGESPTAIDRLAAVTGTRLPRVVPKELDGRLRFSSRVGELNRELAGAVIHRCWADAALELAEAGRWVAAIETPGGLEPIACLLEIGSGQLLLSTVSDPPAVSLTWGLEAGRPAEVLLPLMLLRLAAGDTAYQPPARLANLTVDDPVLAGGPIGLPYRRLVRQAEQDRFHLTVATIPRELPVADPAVVGLLEHRPRLLTACYHGSDHDGYEFYLTDAHGHRHRGRRLEVQLSHLGSAARRGKEFYERTGLALDRIMVFPHGLGPAALLPALEELGFLATSNMADRWPLEASVPDDPFLTLRPADVAWGGAPVMWRQGTLQPGYPLDLFLGRPAVILCHKKTMDGALARAAEINRTNTPDLAWAGLEEIALHAYVSRRDPGRGWHTLAFTDEICLHNPASEPRQHLVSWVRPRANGAIAEQVVEVPPTSELTLQRGGGHSGILPRRARPGCLLGTG